MLAGLDHESLPQTAHRAVVLIADALLDEIRGLAHRGPVEPRGVEAVRVGADVVYLQRQRHVSLPKIPQTGGSALDQEASPAGAAGPALGTHGRPPAGGV